MYHTDEIELGLFVVVVLARLYPKSVEEIMRYALWHMPMLYCTCTFHVATPNYVP